MAGHDDDALKWEGDDDPTLAPGWKVVGAPTARPSEGETDGADADAGASPETDAADSDASAETDASAEPAARQVGSVELVALGILGGVYLLYTVGWLLTTIRSTAAGMGILGDVMYELGLWLAVAAPALWFGLVSAIVRRPGARLAWLVVGAVVLVPLPFALGVPV